MNYVKIFLFGLISFWLLGFLYVFLTGVNNENNTNNDADKEANQIDLTEKNLIASVDYFEEKELKTKANFKFKKLINDLQKLEIKNQKNEIIIKNLQ
jgi:hypothetical protein